MNSIPIYNSPRGGDLSDDMVNDFRDAGVLVLRDFVSVAECDRLRTRAEEMVDGFEPDSTHSVFSTTEQTQEDDRYFIESGDKIRFFLEQDALDEQGRFRQEKKHSLNKMGHAMHDLDPVFDRFSRTPKLARLAKSLGFDDPLLLQSMYIFKPPRIGGEVTCHQDSTYLYTEPESCIGFWFALEDATLENGCMQFIPGGHKQALKKLNYRQSSDRVITETIDATPWPEDKKVAAEADAGTLVIFDGRAPHMSDTNRSSKSRHAYTVHLIERKCHYPAKNWLQRGADLPLRGFE